ncbi:MAG: iron donor protein CyaY [Myxococcales bacterium]|nr:iron donor protein CyaY [Myxococcales bacterium]
MDEATYEQLAAAALSAVLDLFDDVDPDDADVESTGDVIRIELARGPRVVLNTQRPARQIWLAGGKHAWHFSYDDAEERWLDDKGRGELQGVLKALVAELGGIRL